MSAHVNELLKFLVRAFHGPECSVVLDALLRINRSIEDDELAGILKLQQKQVRKVLFDLKGEHIVTCENRNKEALNKGERSTAHRHWFVDYKNAVDCVKYRLHQITKKFNEEKNRELQVQTYVCKQCRNSYSSLDAAALLMNGWKCEHCSGELEEVSAQESISKTQNQVKTLWTQLKPITDTLKRVEAHPIPKFPKTQGAAALTGMEEQSMLISTAPTTVTGGGMGGSGAGGGGGGGHARAASSGPSIGSGQVDVFVDIVGSSQNGVTSKSQNGAAKPAPKAPISWLQGSTQQTTAITTTPIVPEPVKQETEEMDKETYALFVKQYMEEWTQKELADQQNQGSVAGQKHKSNGHTLKEEPGSEGAQPASKKGRMDGEGVQKEIKVELKQEEDSNVVQEFEGEEAAAAPAGDEPIVHFNNQQLPISQITEDHQGQMSTDEYEAYYKIYMSYYFQNQ